MSATGFSSVQIDKREQSPHAGQLEDVPLRDTHYLPISNYNMPRYSEIPQTLKYKGTSLIQIPNSRDPGMRHKVYDLKKTIVAALYLVTNFYPGFSGYDFDRVTVRDFLVNELDVEAHLDYCSCPERAVQPSAACMVAIELSERLLLQRGHVQRIRR